MRAQGAKVFIDVDVEAEICLSGRRHVHLRRRAKILDLPESKLRYWAQVGFVGPSVKTTGRRALQLSGSGQREGRQGAGRARVRGGRDPQGAGAGPRPAAPCRPAPRSHPGGVRRRGPGGRRRGQRFRGQRAEGLRFLSGDWPRQRPSDRCRRRRAWARRRDRTTPATAGTRRGAGERAQRLRLVRRRDARREATARDGDARAEACYRRALALDAGLAAAHTNLGHLAYARGDVAAARAEFEAALALDPEQPEARFNLANLILEAGDLELAVAELRRVLQSAPDFADAHYNLAVALGRLGGRAQARAHLERYLGLEPERALGRAGARAHPAARLNFRHAALAHLGSDPR